MDNIITALKVTNRVREIRLCPVPLSFPIRSWAGLHHTYDLFGLNEFYFRDCRNFCCLPPVLSRFPFEKYSFRVYLTQSDGRLSLHVGQPRGARALKHVPSVSPQPGEPTSASTNHPVHLSRTRAWARREAYIDISYSSVSILVPGIVLEVSLLPVLMVARTKLIELIFDAYESYNHHHQFV